MTYHLSSLGLLSAPEPARMAKKADDASRAASLLPAVREEAERKRYDIDNATNLDSLIRDYLSNGGKPVKTDADVTILLARSSIDPQWSPNGVPLGYTPTVTLRQALGATVPATRVVAKADADRIGLRVFSPTERHTNLRNNLFGISEVSTYKPAAPAPASAPMPAPSVAKKDDEPPVPAAPSSSVAALEDLQRTIKEAFSDLRGILAEHNRQEVCNRVQKSASTVPASAAPITAPARAAPVASTVPVVRTVGGNRTATKSATMPDRLVTKGNDFGAHSVRIVPVKL